MYLLCIEPSGRGACWKLSGSGKDGGRNACCHCALLITRGEPSNWSDMTEPDAIWSVRGTGQHTRSGLQLAFCV